MMPARTCTHRFIFWALLVVIFYSNSLIASPLMLYSNVQNGSHPFDSLAHIAKEKRVDVATLIHKINLRKLPELEAMTYLNQLTTLARDLDDKPLESVVYNLKADYYAVNNLYNNKSIAYYKAAIDFAQRNNLKLEEATYLLHEGRFYTIYKQNNLACLSYLRSVEAFKKYGFNRVPNMGLYFSLIANFYYHLGDYPTAKTYLQQALKCRFEKPREHITVINSLGLIARNTRQYQQGLAYFNHALKLARLNNDTAWIGIAKGNIGAVYFMQGLYGKALPFIQTDYETSLRFKEPLNAAIALLRLVKINLAKNNTQKGLHQLDTAETLINSPITNLSLRAEIFELKAQVYEQLGENSRSLNFRKTYEKIKDSLYRQNNIAAVEVVKMQYVIDKKQAEEARLKARAELDITERNTTFVVLFLLLIISILVYSLQALKTRKDKELLQSEKRRISDELHYTEMKLNTYTESLKKNNALIENFKEQIDHLKNKNTDGGVIRHLEDLMQAHIMTDGSWSEFKKNFLKVYPNFFFDIKKHYLSLSETDIRLLTLIKLQSTNKEIANMLGITVDGVKKAKQRLRKKMNIDNDTSITEAISKLEK